MNLSNFRIPVAVIGLSLISGVAILSFDSIANAQGNREREATMHRMNDPKRFDCYSNETCGGELLSHESPRKCMESGGKSCREHLYARQKCVMWYQMRQRRGEPREGGGYWTETYWELDPEMVKHLY